MDHTRGEYRSMSSFHAPWSPSPARATRAMTDGSLRMARPFQGQRDPVHGGCSLAHLYLALPSPIYAERVRRRLIHRRADGFLSPGRFARVALMQASRAHPRGWLKSGRLPDVRERPQWRSACAGRRLVRFHRVETVRRLPHPGRGFTQGLVLDGDLVWESTGQYGQSSLRRYRLGAEGLDWAAPLPGELFGEGICLAGDRLWQLTWKERVALCWAPSGEPSGTGERPDAEPYTTVRYNREGWGICNAGRWAVTSDGSSELILRDLLTLEPLWTVLVRCEGRRVGGLNDLEWRGDRVWANVGSTACLVGVDLPSGEVLDVVDARAVGAAEHARRDPQSVLNGIAALPDSEDFLLTGKNWKSIHQVRLVPDRKARRAEKLLAL